MPWREFIIKASGKDGHRHYNVCNMPNRSFTTVFWNVWFYAQDGRRDNGTKLLSRLEELIKSHDPDVFGLNEVLVNRHDGSSPVIEFLKRHEYYCHFAPFSPTDANWMVGNLMATRKKPVKISDHVLGNDAQAARRGFTNCTIKAISVDLKYGPITITAIVNYLCSLYPLDWTTHIKHRKNYEKVVNSVNNKNLIIGGDFNETKYMLPWLRLPNEFKRKTGSLINPTWRLNGKRSQIGFANYDNVVYRESGNLKLKSFKVLPRSPSDHSPLLAIFEIE